MKISAAGLPLEQTLGHWAARLSWAARGALERRLRRYKLSPPMMAALLALGSGADRATDLAGVMGVDNAAVTRLLDRLAAGGWVERCELKGDRRAKRLALSDKARALLPRLKSLSASVEAKMSRALSPEQKKELVATLKALTRAAEAL
jgi:MarR family transcriptional regulator for hemolysin